MFSMRKGCILNTGMGSLLVIENRPWPNQMRRALQMNVNISPQTENKIKKSQNNRIVGTAIPPIEVEA